MRLYKNQQEDRKVSDVFKYSKALIKVNVNKSYEGDSNGPTAVFDGPNECVQGTYSSWDSFI